jgi:hypothetical protein
MKKKNLIIITVTAVVIIAVAGVALFVFLNQLPEEQKARDAAMSYIKTNHPQTADLIKNLNWEGGIRNNYEAGKQSYIYSSQGWTVIVQYPLDDASDPTYAIMAVCTSGTIVVEWHGTYHDGTITETSYRYTS